MAKEGCKEEEKRQNARALYYVAQVVTLVIVVGPGVPSLILHVTSPAYLSTPTVSRVGR